MGYIMKRSKEDIKEEIAKLLFELHTGITKYWATKSNDPNFTIDLKEACSGHKNLKVKKEIKRLIKILVDQIFLLIENSGCMTNEEEVSAKKNKERKDKCCSRKVK